jgi:hypothetical protein
MNFVRDKGAVGSDPVIPIDRSKLAENSDLSFTSLLSRGLQHIFRHSLNRLLQFIVSGRCFRFSK